MKKLAFLFCCTILLLSGCATQSLENNLSQIRIANAEIPAKSASERAETIKQNILRLEEIQDAAVIIEGHTALIGIRVKEGEESQSLRLKTQADILARQADETIDGTAITANDSITAMIAKMEQERSL